MELTTSYGGKIFYLRWWWLPTTLATNRLIFHIFLFGLRLAAWDALGRKVGNLSNIWKFELCLSDCAPDSEGWWVWVAVMYWCKEYQWVPWSSSSCHLFCSSENGIRKARRPPTGAWSFLFYFTLPRVWYNTRYYGSIRSLPDIYNDDGYRYYVLHGTATTVIAVIVPPYTCHLYSTVHYHYHVKLGRLSFSFGACLAFHEKCDDIDSAVSIYDDALDLFTHVFQDESFIQAWKSRGFDFPRVSTGKRESMQSRRFCQEKTCVVGVTSTHSDGLFLNPFLIDQ